MRLRVKHPDLRAPFNQTPSFVEPSRSPGRHAEDQARAAARREELSSTQRKLQDRIELVDRVQAGHALREVGLQCKSLKLYLVMCFIFDTVLYSYSTL